MPGFEAIGEVTHYGSKVFEKTENPAVRLTVIMANRLPLEQQTGADLIYFNEAYRSFAMVQYKAMKNVKIRWNFDGRQAISSSKGLPEWMRCLWN